MTVSIEDENYSVKVQKMLMELSGLSIKKVEKDLYLVSEPETGVEFTADVEGDILFLRAEVAQVKNPSVEFLEFLLKINATAIHVAFGLDGQSLILKGNLELKNLDANELEATCRSLVLTLYNVSDDLTKFLSK